MATLYRKALPLRPAEGTVLFWVPGGMALMLHVEGAIAAALRLRGVGVHAVICDGAFRACVRREISDRSSMACWQDLCPVCKAETGAILEAIGIPYSFIGDFVPGASRAVLWDETAGIAWETLDGLSYRDVHVGANVRSGIERYLKGADLAGHEQIVREYAFSGLVCAAAATRAIEHVSPSRVFMSHGVYVDWGPALQTALAHGLPVSAWMASYLRAHLYFRHVEDLTRVDFHNMSEAAWRARRDTALSPLEGQRLDEYSRDRYQRHISFDMKRIKKYSGETERLRRQYVTYPDRPVWGILAHINWDCVSDYSPMAYDSFDEWMLDTLREISKVTEVNWLVKIHPAEAWDAPESGVQRLIERHFPALPSHIRVLPAEEEISPLDFYELVDGAVTVYGTAGLEMALLGKPIILAGEAHYGGKGFTHDGLDVESYRTLLRRVGSLGPPTEEQLRIARQYAYCYFIQRQVPLPVVHAPSSGWWAFQHDKRELLLPGKEPFMDLVCDRILDGKDFIMDEELVRLALEFATETAPTEASEEAD